MEDRTKYIGGSDAAAAIGLSRWRSPLDVYAEKTGAVAPPDLSDNERVEWGIALEDLVAEKYSEKTKRKVRKWTKLIKHKEYPFIGAHVDRFVYDGKKGKGVLEIKTTDSRNAQEWYDCDGEPCPPLEYSIQLQLYLLVTGCEWGAFAVLIGGNRFLYFDVNRNDAFCSMLLERLKIFWGMVESNEEPELSENAELDRRALGKLHQLHSEVIKKHSSDTSYLMAVDASLLDVKDKLKELQQKKTALETQIIKEIADDEGVELLDGTVYTWSMQSKDTLDRSQIPADVLSKAIKPTTFRVLRRRKSK